MNVTRAKKDCIYFGEKYFPHLTNKKSAKFHKEIIGIIEDKENERLDILAPRGHAKSTWISIIYPMWKIINNRNINIFIISDTIDQAEIFLRVIKDEFELNEELIKDYGKFMAVQKKGESSVWRVHNITVIREKRGKEPTIVCAGTGKRIVGRRADLIVVDDPLNDENTSSEKQRKKTLRWFMKTMTPIANPEGGKIVVIGTKKHPDDLHKELGKNIEYKQFIYKALDDEKKPLWKEKWSLRNLEKTKNEIGSAIFSQEYQNEAIDEENAIFKREWLERCKKEKYVMGALSERFIRNVVEKGRYRIFSGWDLSLIVDKNRAEERDTDYTVGITILVDENGKRRIIEIYRQRGLTPTSIINAIKKNYEVYKPDIITVENNLFQILYEYKLIKETDMPVVGHTTTRRDKVDLYEGIPSLSVLFENRKYVLPTGDEYSRKMIDILITELVGLGIETHDDTVMALWITECGISKYKEITNTLEVIDDPTL